MSVPAEPFRARMGALYAAQFVVIGTYMPFMPPWLAARGLSPAEIGLLLTVPMVARAALAPWIAYAIDRHGERRTALALLSLGAAAATAGLYLAAGMAALLAIFCAIALFWCALMPVTDAAALAGARSAGLDYGRMRLWGSASFIAANVGAGMLVDRFSPDAAIGIIVVAFLAGGWFAFVLPDLDRTEAAAPPPTMAETRRLLTRPAFLAVLVAAGLLNASHAALYGFGTLHWAAQGHSGTVIGWLWAVGVLAEIALFARAGGVVRRFGAQRLLVIAAAACVLRWSAMTFEPSLAALVVLQLLHGLTFGAAHLGIVHLVADALPGRLGATAQSVMYAVSSVLMAAATLAAGWLYGLYAGQVFWAMTGIAALALAAFVALAQGSGRAGRDAPKA